MRLRRDSRSGLGLRALGAILFAICTLFPAATPKADAASAAPAGDVLIAGGENHGGGVLGSSVLYNAATNMFVSSASMNTPREFAAAVVLTRGKHLGPFAGQVLILGGRDASGNTLSSTELYDPFQGVFAPPSTTPVMSAARAFAVAVVLTRGPNKGKVLIAGGSNDSGPLASAELYDPAHNSFAPAASMNSPREFAAAAVLTSGPHAGMVLIAGGSNDGGLLASTELYDPVKNVFAPVSGTATMNAARAFATAALLINGPNRGKILIAGGSGGSGPLASTELYDPVHNTFAPISGTAVMNSAREFAASAVLTRGKNAGEVLIVGGSDDNGPLKSTELYDPVKNSFAAASTAATMNDARAFPSATVLSTAPSAGKVLIADGSDDSGALATTELYDGVAKTFAAASQTASQPSARRYGVTVLLTPEASHPPLGAPSPAPTPAPPAISIAPTNSSISKGAKEQLRATQSSNGMVQDVTASVTWASSDTSVAVVSNTAGSQGQATGQGPGFVTVTATLNGIQALGTLTVNPPSLSSITVTPSNPSIAKGATQQFVATGNYSDGSTQNITSSVSWGSSGVTIAAISNTAGSQGQASGVAVGSVTITATLNTPQGGIQGSAGLTVNPPALTAIIVTPANVAIPKGAAEQFKAMGSFTDGTMQDVTALVTWNSSNASVATISNADGSQGLATAVGAVGVGPTAITAVSGAIQAPPAMASVAAPILDSITVTPAAPTLPLGSTLQFTATGNFSDGSTQNLTTLVIWASSNAAVATISNASGSLGLASTVTQGPVTISAVSAGIQGFTAATVGPPAVTSISVTPINPSIPNQATQQFDAMGTFTDGSIQDVTDDVTWASSASAVAIISNAAGLQGLATGVSAGTVLITASLNGVLGSTNLTVRSVTLLSIMVTPPTATFAAGATQQFMATGTFSDGSTGNVTTTVKWTSQSKSVVTINGVGLATGQSSGSTTVQAALSGVTGKASVTVQ